MNDENYRFGIKMEERLSRLEATVEVLTGNVNQLATSIETLINNQKTQWSPILGSIAVAVSILGGLITLGSRGPLQDIDNLKSAYAIQQNDSIVEAYGRGIRDGKLDRLQDYIKDNREDQERYQKRMDEIIRGMTTQLESIKSSRFTGRDGEKLMAEIKELRAELDSHQMEEGHQPMVERMEDAQRRIQKLEDMIHELTLARINPKD